MFQSLTDKLANAFKKFRNKGKLTEREKRIIDMRFFTGKTQVEIAREIGISQAQVSRLEKAAIGKIKKQM